MQVRLEGKDGPEVGSPVAMVEQFAKGMRDRQSNWAEKLTENPDGLATLEEEIHQQFAMGAGHLVGALLARVTSRAEMNKHVKHAQANALG